jgi:hypothetical protein
MIKLNKGYNLNFIVLIASIIFLFTKTAYPCPLKDSLRVQMNQKILYERMEGIKNILSGNEKPEAALGSNADVLRREGFKELAPGYFLNKDGFFIQLGDTDKFEKLFTRLSYIYKSTENIIAVDIDNDRFGSLSLKIIYENKRYKIIHPINGSSSAGSLSEDEFSPYVTLSSDDSFKDRLSQNGFREIISDSGVFELAVEEKGKVIIVYINKKILFIGTESRYIKSRYVNNPKIVGYAPKGLLLQEGPLKYRVNSGGYIGFEFLDTSVELKIPLTKKQKYTEGPNSAGFIIGGVNTNEIISNLTELTGVPISEIEHSARPRSGSMAGFIGKNEQFLDVLKADNTFVISRGFTHQQLAEPLFYAMNLVNLTEGGEDFEFRYRGTLYRVNYAGSRGIQETIFNDDAEASRDYTVVNTENGALVNFSAMVPEYIWRYGFYEGNTEYRVDPARIVDVFFADKNTDPILRARAGENVDLDTDSTIQRLANLPPEAMQSILPRLTLNIADLPALLVLQRLVEQQRSLASDIMDRVSIRLEPFSITVGSGNLNYLIEAWEHADDSIRNHIAEALQAITDIGEDIADLELCLERVSFDGRIISKILLQTDEEARVILNFLAFKSDYTPYKTSGLSSKEEEIAKLLKIAVQKVLKGKSPSQTSFKVVQAEKDIKTTVAIFKAFQSRSSGCISVGKGSSSQDNTVISRYFTIHNKSLFAFNPSTKAIECSYVGLSSDKRILVGIVDNFFYALSKDGSVDIVQVINFNEIAAIMRSTESRGNAPESSYDTGKLHQNFREVDGSV